MTTSLKRCSRCHKQKSLEDFHRQRSSSDGRHTYCKLCAKSYRAEHGPRYRADHAATIMAYNVRRNVTHPGYQRQYRTDNREALTKKRADNAESNAERARHWRVANSDQRRRQRVKRKRLVAGAPSVPYTRREIWALDGGLCPVAWCKCPDGRTIDFARPARIAGTKKRDPWSLDIDHVLPIILGGDDTPDNVRPMHAHCNGVRHINMLPTEVLATVTSFIVKMVEKWAAEKGESVA